MLNLVWPHCGVAPNTSSLCRLSKTSLHRKDSNIDWNFGQSSTLWGQTPKHASNRPRWRTYIENVLSACIRASDVWLVLFPLVVSFALLFGPALVLPVSFWLKLVYPTSRLKPLTPLTIMDSPHGREIHYHLARALIFEQHRKFSSFFRTCCRLG